jgi:hypothetical protein
MSETNILDAFGIPEKNASSALDEMHGIEDLKKN